MSLFISNSSDIAPNQMENIMSFNNKSFRNVYLKMVVAIFVGMGLSLLLLRVFADLNDASKEGIMGRVAEAQDALPSIVKESKDLVMFFGSSMTGAGFSPRRFDRDVNLLGKNIKSFNFGFGGLNPYFQEYLSRRIADRFKSSNRRLKLAMIEFNPFQASQTRWNRARFTLDSFMTMLASDQELWEITKQDLTRGVRLFNIKYLRNDISAEMLTSYYGQALFPQKYPKPFKEDEEVIKKKNKLGEELGELFNKEYPDYKGEQWSYAWQGAGTIPEERSEHTLQVFKEYYKVSHTDIMMKNDRLGRIYSADIEKLHFEPLLIDSFIKIVKNFQQFSDNVEVIMLPRNIRWIHYSEGAKKRLANAVRQIEDATGIVIKNHQDIEPINPDMFRDSTHLARYLGDIAYTDFLVKEYLEKL